MFTVAQLKQCSCTIDKSISESGVSNCQTTRLSDGSSLYYQFNCDSVWLTLNNKLNRKRVIYVLKGEDYKDLCGYNFRLGYQLAKEYKKYLLFRSGCGANGPCNFILIDKLTGKKVKEFGELIYNHQGMGHFYKFVIYFTSDRLNRLAIHYLDSGKKYFIPVNPVHFNNAIPEYTFDDVTIQQSKLLLKYGLINGKTKIITFNISTHPG